MNNLRITEQEFNKIIISIFYHFRKLWSAAYDVALSAKHLFDVIQEVRKNEKSGIDKISATEDAENKHLLMKIYS